LSRLPLVLDAEGWKAVAGELESLVDRIDKIQRASGKRLLKSDHEGELRGELVTMLFEAAEAAKGNRSKPSRDGKSAARSRR
jgi:hypothetical protein